MHLYKTKEVRLNFLIKIRKYFIVKNEKMNDKKIDNKFKEEKYISSDSIIFLIP